MPNFLIIGAPKCGTTSLYEYLIQHPDIYMSPVKEPRFFALDGLPLNFGGPWGQISNRVSINDLARYQALFEGVREEKAIGEASPLYLSDTRAPERIQHYVPDVKMIAILRDPVERAYSGYMMHIMMGRETLPFEKAIADEPRRIRENWLGARYLDTGRYAEQLTRYYDRFDKSQLRVYLYEDLRSNARAVVQGIFNFLNVDSTFAPDLSVNHNMSGVPKNKWIDLLIGRRSHRGWLRTVKPFVPQRLIQTRDNLRKKNLTRPTLDPELRQRLIPLFREDILRLQQLINRDLSHWLI